MRIPRKAQVAALLTAGAAVLVTGTAAVTALYAYHHQAVPPPATAGSAPHPLATAGLPAAREYLGVFKRGDTTSWAPVGRFAAAAGVRPGIVLYYSAWGGPFNAAFAARAAAHHAIPFVQLLPRGVSLASIAGGDSDQYLRSYALAVRSYGLPVILSFAPEMNGRWYPWGWTHTPPRVWVAAWRHIVTVFRGAGARNVTWLWTANVSGKGDGPLRDYWPGARYVTWAGVDGYFYHPRPGFARWFGPTIHRIRRLTGVPILLSETAVGQVAGQARMIPALFAGVRQYHLLGLVWFDVCQHQGVVHQCWQLEGHPAAIAAFRRGAAQLLAH